MLEVIVRDFHPLAFVKEHIRSHGWLPEGIKTGENDEDTGVGKVATLA
jgi:hypothetical protein